MRHSKIRHQLNRSTSWRRATVNSLARNLLICQSIRTTKARAMAARGMVEGLISLGKVNSLAAKRKAFSVLGDHKLVSLLFADIAPRFEKKNGGYTRILTLGKRRGDNAELVIFELTEIKKKEVHKKVKKEKEAQPEDQAKKSEPAKEETHKETRPPIEKKPPKKFLGGIKNIFKKERDSL
ncbi:MAG: 50S ribosomal protein L17 [Candidatus Omnitrophica bacterium]|nr:50S ribosomal protein L17 [Candidatus Omnitrophota bacterium]